MATSMLGVCAGGNIRFWGNIILAGTCDRIVGR